MNHKKYYGRALWAVSNRNTDRVYKLDNTNQPEVGCIEVLVMLKQTRVQFIVESFERLALLKEPLVYVCILGGVHSGNIGLLLVFQTNTGTIRYGTTISRERSAVSIPQYDS